MNTKALRGQLNRNTHRSSTMTPKTTLAMILTCTLMSAGMAQADHNNPWAGENDVTLSKNHDANQARSIGTPGEDEMRGVMTRSAKGKLGGTGAGKGGQGGEGGKGGGH
jgi:hypothetical protein